jgi:hypothetical protein
MSKTVLFTTLHLLGFRVTEGGGSSPIDLRKCVHSREDITVELTVKDRFEVNAIIGTKDGKPNVPVWAMDYKSTKLAKENTAVDLWKMAIIHDQTYDSYTAAHDAIVYVVDNLILSKEPAAASNLDTVRIP